MTDIRQITKRLIHRNLQMLRCNFIGNRDGFRDILYQNNLSIVVNGCSCDFRSGEQCNLPLQLCRYRLCQGFAFRHQNRRSHFVMLRLRKQIRRNDFRIGIAVRNDKNFARPCNHINRNLPEHLLFRFCNKGIAGAYDFIHTRDAFRSIRKRRNRLCAADSENTVNPGDVRRRNDIGV